MNIKETHARICNKRVSISNKMNFLSATPTTKTTTSKKDSHPKYRFNKAIRIIKKNDEIIQKKCKNSDVII